MLSTKGNDVKNPSYLGAVIMLEPILGLKIQTINDVVFDLHF